jgi:hypothetical protein
MLSLAAMKSQKIKTPSTNMDLYALCRWASLKEAVDIVGDKCEERNIDFDTFDLKPLELLKYVDSMTDDLYNKVLLEEKNV